MSARIVTLNEMEYARRIRNYGRMTNAPDALIRSTVSAGLVQLRSVRKEEPRHITVPKPLVPTAPQPRVERQALKREVRFEETAAGWLALGMILLVAAGVAAARFYLAAIGKPV